MFARAVERHLKFVRSLDALQKKILDIFTEILEGKNKIQELLTASKELPKFDAAITAFERQDFCAYKPPLSLKGRSLEDLVATVLAPAVRDRDSKTFWYMVEWACQQCKQNVSHLATIRYHLLRIKNNLHKTLTDFAARPPEFTLVVSPPISPILGASMVKLLQSDS